MISTFNEEKAFIFTSIFDFFEDNIWKIGRFFDINDIIFLRAKFKSIRETFFADFTREFFIVEAQADIFTILDC